MDFGFDDDDYHWDYYNEEQWGFYNGDSIDGDLYVQTMGQCDWINDRDKPWGFFNDNDFDDLNYHEDPYCDRGHSSNEEQWGFYNNGNSDVESFDENFNQGESYVLDYHGQWDCDNLDDSFHDDGNHCFYSNENFGLNKEVESIDGDEFVQEYQEKWDCDNFDGLSQDEGYEEEKLPPLPQTEEEFFDIFEIWPNQECQLCEALFWEHLYVLPKHGLWCEYLEEICDE